MSRFLYKIFLLFLLSVLAEENILPQNLVPNGSFNKCTNCPGNTDGQFIYVKDWLGMFDRGYKNGNQQFPTIEYFHSCGNGFSNMPHSSLIGYERTRTGKGMAGMKFNFWNGLLSSLEWITVPLKDTLQKDSLYCVTYYVRKTNAYTDHWRHWNMSTNTFTATFTPDTLIGKGCQ